MTVDTGYKVYMKLHIRNIARADITEYRWKQELDKTYACQTEMKFFKLRELERPNDTPDILSRNQFCLEGLVLDQKSKDFAKLD